MPATLAHTPHCPGSVVGGGRLPLLGSLPNFPGGQQAQALPTHTQATRSLHPVDNTELNFLDLINTI